MRQQAVTAIREGQDVSSVAAAYGVNVRSVFRWAADFANGGQKALLARPIPGRPPKVSGQPMRWLARTVKDHTPLPLQFAFGLWTLSLIAALSEREFATKLSLASVSTTVLRQFLERLLIAANQPIFLIGDGHPIYKAKLVTEFVQAQDGKLKLLYLPFCLPHLNPDEQVRAHVKRLVARQLVETKDEMKRLALGAWRRIQKLPELVKCFFRQRQCLYSAL